MPVPRQAARQGTALPPATHSGVALLKQLQQRPRHGTVASASIDTSSNLGYLARHADTAADAADVWTRVSPSSFENRGLYVDGGNITASLVCLAVILYFSLDRILGIDQRIAAALRDWRERRAEEKREAVNDARQQLEARWRPGGEDDTTPGMQ